MPEVAENSGACDPAELCRNLTPNIVRAFLYWMCTRQFQEVGFPPVSWSTLADGCEIQDAMQRS